MVCASVLTQATVNEDGYPVRDPGSSSYVATFAPAAAFGKLMAAEARRRGAAHVRQLTILGDGAVRIWNLASEHSPEATRDRGSSTTRRLKLSGMHWSVPGATGILTLRCQHASGRWEEIWQQPNNQTPSPDLATRAS